MVWVWELLRLFRFSVQEFRVWGCRFHGYIIRVARLFIVSGLLGLFVLGMSGLMVQGLGLCRF